MRPLLDLDPRPLPFILERNHTFGGSPIGRNRQRTRRARSGDLPRDEGRAVAQSPDLDTLGGKNTRKRNAVRTALTGDRLRSVTRGVGDVIALLCVVGADLLPLVIPSVLKRYRARIITCTCRNNKSNRGCSVRADGMQQSADIAADRHYVRKQSPSNCPLALRNIRRPPPE